MSMSNTEKTVKDIRRNTRKYHDLSLTHAIHKLPPISFIASFSIVEALAAG